jgi:hypothetical protein
MPEYWVTIDGERGAYWERLLGRRSFRVHGPAPEAWRLPGYPDGAPCYLLDLEGLTGEERSRLAIGLADRFGEPVPTAAQLADGVPILALGTTLRYAHPVPSC